MGMARLGCCCCFRIAATGRQGMAMSVAWLEDLLRWLGALRVCSRAVLMAFSGEDFCVAIYTTIIAICILEVTSTWRSYWSAWRSLGGWNIASPDAAAALLMLLVRYGLW